MSVATLNSIVPLFFSIQQKVQPPKVMLGKISLLVLLALCCNCNSFAQEITNKSGPEHVTVEVRLIALDPAALKHNANRNRVQCQIAEQVIAELLNQRSLQSLRKLVGKHGQPEVVSTPSDVMCVLGSNNQFESWLNCLHDFGVQTVASASIETASNTTANCNVNYTHPDAKSSAPLYMMFVKVTPATVGADLTQLEFVIHVKEFSVPYDSKITPGWEVDFGYELKEGEMIVFTKPNRVGKGETRKLGDKMLLVLVKTRRTDP